MSHHYSKLSPSHQELLVLLQEECAETIQIISKILRHGLESWHPEDSRRVPNSELLAGEYGHVMAAAEMLRNAGVLDVDIADESRAVKLEKVKQYLHSQ